MARNRIDDVRNLVGLAVFFFLIASCASRPTSRDLASMEDFATGYTSALCSQDPSRVASFFAERGSLKINEGAPSVGHAAITAAARGFMDAFPDMVVTMDELTGAGDRFVYRWTLTGTNTGAGGTGKQVRISGCEEWTMGTDGRIQESLGHFDEADYHRQLGTGVSSPANWPASARGKVPDHPCAERGTKFVSLAFHQGGCDQEARKFE